MLGIRCGFYIYNTFQFRVASFKVLNCHRWQAVNVPESEVAMLSLHSPQEIIP
jgi:hypothetical protein